MSSDSRWIRLNVDWETSTWLEDLEWGDRAVWAAFLCHVKLNGNGRGKCKAISEKAFARQHDIPLDCVERFFAAAADAQAIATEDGAWIVTGWETYQSPDAARVRKMRTPEDTRNNPEQDGPVRNNSDLSVTNATCSVSCHATETETGTETLTKIREGSAAAPPKPKKASMVVPTKEEVAAYFKASEAPMLEARKFYAHFDGNGWRTPAGPLKKWQAAADKWILNGPQFAARGSPNGSVSETLAEQSKRLLVEAGFGTKQEG